MPSDEEASAGLRIPPKLAGSRNPFTVKASMHTLRAPWDYVVSLKTTLFIVEKDFPPMEDPNANSVLNHVVPAKDGLKACQVIAAEEVVLFTQGSL